MLSACFKVVVEFVLLRSYHRNSQPKALLLHSLSNTSCLGFPLHVGKLLIVVEYFLR